MKRGENDRPSINPHGITYVTMDDQLCLLCSTVTFTVLNSIIDDSHGIPLQLQ